jgi:Uma2 family endonuclease
MAMAIAVQAPDRIHRPQLLESDILYEVVDGKRVELPPMGIRQVAIASRLTRFLDEFADSHKRGLVVTEGLFLLNPERNLERRPDVAFVSYERWPEDEISEGDGWPAIPDLAVEVISKSNRAEDVREKISEYLRYGVRLVWVIYPKQKLVEVHSGSQSRVLTINDELDGGDVLPGFRLPVAALFAVLVKPE